MAQRRPGLLGGGALMEGFIWVYSEVGRGTTFRLYFPERTRAIDRVREADDASQFAVDGGGRRMLVVEDDAGVRDFVVRLLRGYDVTASTRRRKPGDGCARPRRAWTCCSSMWCARAERPKLLERLQDTPLAVFR